MNQKHSVTSVGQFTTKILSRFLYWIIQKDLRNQELLFWIRNQFKSNQYPKSDSADMHILSVNTLTYCLNVFQQSSLMKNKEGTPTTFFLCIFSFRSACFFITHVFSLLFNEVHFHKYVVHGCYDVCIQLGIPTVVLGSTVEYHLNRTYNFETRAEIHWFCQHAGVWRHLKHGCAQWDAHSEW